MKTEIKEVCFNGDKLVVVRDCNDGKTYVGIRWICEALGLQYRKQVDKLKKHEALVKGMSVRALPSSGGIQYTLCIELDFLPLWLVTISPSKIITATKEKLVEYQLKAKDVLANAFLVDTQQVSSSRYIIPQSHSEALRLAANLQEKIERDAPKVHMFERFIDSTGYQTMNDVAKSLGEGRNRLMKKLRKLKILMADNMPYQRYIEQGLFAAKQRTIMGKACVQPFVTPKGIAFISEVI